MGEKSAKAAGRRFKMKQDRLDQILKYIVEDFIRTSQPVGSQNLIKDHNLSYSSATIRNDMAKLEKEGLIEKRHTSGGRVPSTKGLQYYIDHLKDDEVENSTAVDGFDKEFAMVFRNKAQSFEDMISKSCEVLSQVTSLAAVSLGNRASNENLTSVTLTPLSPSVATVILLTDRGHVENKTFPVKKDTDMNSLTTGIKILNSRLTGTPISEIEERVKAIEPILKAQIGKDTQVVIEAFVEAFVSFAKKRYHSYGVTKLLSNPTYENDKNSVMEALKVLEGKVGLDEGVLSEKEDDGTNVRLAQGANVAVVSHKVDLPGLPKTEVAVVGPKGMDYKKVMAALKCLSDNIQKYFNTDDESSIEPSVENDLHKQKMKKKGG